MATLSLFLGQNVMASKQSVILERQFYNDLEILYNDIKRISVACTFECYTHTSG